jgi:hypothetical protein
MRRQERNADAANFSIVLTIQMDLFCLRSSAAIYLVLVLLANTDKTLIKYNTFIP